MIYNKGDIVAVWIVRIYKGNWPENEHVLQGFGEVYKYGMNYVNVKWIKIPHRKYMQREKNKNLYRFIGDRCSLIVKAEDRSGNEDWKSLIALLRLKGKIIDQSKACLKCGSNMHQVKDLITNKYTGKLWSCRCSAGKIISIG